MTTGATRKTATASRTVTFLHRLLPVAVFVCGSGWATAQEPSFRTGVNLVLLDAGVTNSKGIPVTGLGPENFELKEEGVSQEITRFEPGSASVSLALVVDASGSMRPRWGAVIESVRSFASLLRPGDEAVLFAFNEHSSLLFPLADVASLLPTQSLLAGQWVSALAAYAPTGQTALYDAVIRASGDLRESLHERRVVVVLSDGEDTASAARRDTAIEALQSENRLVYCIGLFAPGDEGTDAGALRKLAESTGGLALFDQDRAALPGMLARVIHDLRARYVLEFHSAAAPVGKTEVRKLSLAAWDESGKRLRVRSREGYRAIGPAPPETSPRAPLH